MRDIYQNAERVLNWLGEEQDDSALLMPDETHSYRETPPELDNESAKDLINAFNKLFSRPWFCRTWTVQEACLAKEAIFFCGHSSGSWDKLLFSFIQFGQDVNTLCEPNVSLFDPKPCSSYMKLANLRMELGNGLRGGMRNLFNLMYFLWPWNSTDPRDKAFGMLGIAQDTQDGSFPVDYALDLDTVYRTVTQYSIEATRSFYAIGFANPAVRSPSLLS